MYIVAGFFVPGSNAISEVVAKPDICHRHHMWCLCKHFCQVNFFQIERQKMHIFTFVA